MIKPIKFFLNLPGNNDENIRIKNLEDLRENFHLDILFDFFKAGILDRWLESQGATEELRELTQISKTELSKDNLVKFICVFFKDGFPPALYSEIEKAYCLQQEICKEKKAFKNEKEKNKEIIVEYFSNYKELISTLIDSKEKMPVVKEKVNKIVSDYYEIFEYDKDALLKQLWSEAPISILFFIANQKTRQDSTVKKYYSNILDSFSHNRCSLKIQKLEEFNKEYSFSSLDDLKKVKAFLESCSQIDKNDKDEFTKEIGDLIYRFKDYSGDLTNEESIKTLVNSLKDYLFSHAFINDPNFRPYIEQNNTSIVSTIKVCNKSTFDMWDDIENNKKDYLILYAEAGSVRGHKEQGKELKDEDIRNLEIVKGLDFRSKDSNNVVIYMEI